MTKLKKNVIKTFAWEDDEQDASACQVSMDAMKPPREQKKNNHQRCSTKPSRKAELKQIQAT
jgi:hypothetical protein